MIKCNHKLALAIAYAYTKIKPIQIAINYFRH